MSTICPSCNYINVEPTDRCECCGASLTGEQPDTASVEFKEAAEISSTPYPITASSELDDESKKRTAMVRTGILAAGVLQLVPVVIGIFQLLRSGQLALLVQNSVVAAGYGFATLIAAVIIAFAFLARKRPLHAAILPLVLYIGVIVVGTAMGSTQQLGIIDHMTIGALSGAMFMAFRERKYRRTIDIFAGC